MKKEARIAIARGIFEEQMPFNQWLGMEFTVVNEQEVRIAIDMRPELTGNPFHGILHGGVTATLLDVAGGVVAMVNVLLNAKPDEVQGLMEELKNMGTIDLRIDYLRPGRGKRFEAVARMVRLGKRVAVTRMMLANEKGAEIAMGTASYMLGGG